MYKRIHIIPNNLNEEVNDIVIGKLVNNKDFDKSDIEIETYESIQKSKYPQEYDDGGFIILVDLNEDK